MRRAAINTMALGIVGLMLGCGQRTDAPKDDDEAAVFDGAWGPDGGLLQIAPAALRLERDGDDSERQGWLQLVNLGTGPVILLQAELVDPASGHLSWGEPLPAALSPGQRLDVEVRLRPGDCGGAAPTLRLHTSESTKPPHDIPIELPGRAPELVASPSVLQFGVVGDSGAAADVELTNVGECAAQIDSIVVEGDSEFDVIGEPPSALAALQTDIVTVQVRPTAAAIEAELVVTEASTATELRVPLSANVNACPWPIARIGVDGQAPVEREQIDVAPLTTLRLDGSQSVDPDGDVVGYEWRVAARPDGSQAALSDDGQVVAPTVRLDLAGSYAFELRVTDDRGLASCDVARIEARAVPEGDLHVQLVWNTPGDPDQTDAHGTDLDLHLLRLPGQWNQSPDDCTWHTRRPNWGSPTQTADNPNLDIDDTNGAGPENITLPLPAPDSRFSIGVDTYSDRELGPSYATVRIFIGGELVFEALDRELTRTAMGWEVATIDWSTRSVELVDRVGYSILR